MLREYHEAFKDFNYSLNIWGNIAKIVFLLALLMEFSDSWFIPIKLVILYLGWYTRPKYMLVILIIGIMGLTTNYWMGLILIISLFIKRRF